MNQPYIKLQESERILVLAASQIYAAYITSGAVGDDNRGDYLKRSIREAIQIAQITDATVTADGETS